MLLASCIHDMKNSISMILGSADMLSEDNQTPEQATKHMTNLRFEASRLNNDLIHLLGVYRLAENELPVIIDEHEVYEVLHDQYLKNETLIKKSNVKLDILCDEDEIWYFDITLSGGVINNILVNAVRYCESHIQLSASIVDQQLCIQISDDGRGYPEDMLHTPDKPLKSIDFRTGSTSLGLYFSGKVAKLHKKGEVRGHISLQNGGDLGGGIFTLHIP